MQRFEYEIFLGSNHILADEWQDFLVAVQCYLGGLSSWSIQITFEYYMIHYYLISPLKLPSSFQLAGFMLKPAQIPHFSTKRTGWPVIHRLEDNCAIFATHLQRKQLQLQALIIHLSGWRQGIIGYTRALVANPAGILQSRLVIAPSATLLSVDFERSKNFTYKKIPKYLNLDKVAPLFCSRTADSLLEVDTFPYGNAEACLQLEQYDFARHSLILGGSGMGKSKFIASIIHQLCQKHPEEYQIVVIDPHDALKTDLAHIANRIVVDFVSPDSSIDLFAARTQNLSASVELTISLFQSLIVDNYNSRLERVLRYSIYLLSVAQSFTFATLRQLLTDLEYRQQLLAQHRTVLPESVAQFFLTDFQELKTKSYSEAIAPVIAFIDEMQMVPTFNQTCQTVGLEGALQDTFLTIFSLNRLQFGDKVVRTLAGLLMQQLFLLAQSRTSDKHFLIIIDEVAVVENPILPRFLSELRKYGVSVFLAGQYFAQISTDLRHSIFANTSNYYLFRVSRTDANLLTANLEIKLVGSDAIEDQAKLLSGLKSRECLAQISYEGKNLPIFKARTTDCIIADVVPSKPIPKISTSSASITTDDSDFDFAFDDTDIGDFMPSISTSRQIIN